MDRGARESRRLRSSGDPPPVAGFARPGQCVHSVVCAHPVDYADVPTDNLGWLRDPDDWPVMQTAVAATADALVTDNSADFPLGEVRNGILILGSRAFLRDLFERHADAEASVRAFLASRPPG